MTLADLLWVCRELGRLLVGVVVAAAVFLGALLGALLVAFAIIVIAVMVFEVGGPL